MVQAIERCRTLPHIAQSRQEYLSKSRNNPSFATDVRKVLQFEIVMSFSSIPVLDLSLAHNSDTKPLFLESLRHALLEVGFLYIKNTGISDALIKDVIAQGKAFFDLPEEKKLEVQMKNAPSFLGLTAWCTSATSRLIDFRLQ